MDDFKKNNIEKLYRILIEIALRYFNKYPEVQPIQDEDYCFDSVHIPIAMYKDLSIQLVWKDGRMTLQDIPECISHWHRGFEVIIAKHAEDGKPVDYETVFDFDCGGDWNNEELEFSESLMFNSYELCWGSLVYSALERIEIHGFHTTHFADKDTTSARPGYVYLLQSPTKAYKIGRSKNPQDRLKTFSVKLPFEVEYIALIKAPDMVGLERQLHQRFADKRINGEWFKLSTEDIEYIKGLQS